MKAPSTSRWPFENVSITPRTSPKKPAKIDVKMTYLKQFFCFLVNKKTRVHGTKTKDRLVKSK